MSIFPHRIESLLDELDGSIPYVQTGLIKIGKTERHDWRPIFDLCKRIQEEFKGCRDFPTKERREAAWQRFQTLRTKASSLADEERETFQYQSERLRDDVLATVKGCKWHPIDDVLFFFDPTSVDDMKKMADRLKKAGTILSENKKWMLTAHKNECFQAIQEARESHDWFWEKRKKLSEERRAASQRKREEFEAKRAAWEAKTRANIAKNREKLDKAESARDRTRENIRDLESKMYETKSATWQDRYSGWIDEARAKLSDIEESIDRLNSWIREDEEKLYK